MSFFGPGGTGRNIAGLLGDVLLQQGGMQPIYAPTVKQRQQMEYEEQQRQRRRLEAREDMQWQWENEPDDPYLARAERLARWYEQYGEAATPDYSRARSDMVATQNANVTGEEFRNEFGRPRSPFGRGLW